MPKKIWFCVKIQHSEDIWYKIQKDLCFFKTKKDILPNQNILCSSCFWGFLSPYPLSGISWNSTERRYRTPIIPNRNVIFLQEALIYKANSQRYRQVYHTAINVWMHNGMQSLISIMCLDDALLFENCRWSQRRKLKQILLKLWPSNALLRLWDKRQKMPHNLAQ